MQETLKNLKGREAMSEEQLQDLELTANQRSHIKRLQSTISRLNNPLPARPSVTCYQGNPLITVGVSLNPQTPLIACVVDLQTGSILDWKDTKQLLTAKISRRIEESGVFFNPRRVERTHLCPLVLSLRGSQGRKRLFSSRRVESGVFQCQSNPLTQSPS